MQRPGSQRLRALLVLFALMGAGLGLPLFDAIVFHGQPIARAECSVAPEGAQSPHTQLCILDHPGLLEGSVVSSGHETLATIPEAAPLAGLPASPEPSADAALLPPSRAPPVV
jgi:hypothetical protein